jgi:hypothetical protein
MSKLPSHAARQAKALGCVKVNQPRSPNQHRLFQRGAPPTTTGQLLLEVALFAAENMAFTQQGEAMAADRARDHLMQIRELASRRLAELPSPKADASADAL